MTTQAADAAARDRASGQSGRRMSRSSPGTSVTRRGSVPVARSLFELLATGAAITLEGRIEQNAVILSSLALPSFAGLALTVVPWLLAGGTLALHHPFDDMAFSASSRRAEQCTIAITPGPLALRLADAGAFNRRDGARSVIAPWRAPETPRRRAPNLARSVDRPRRRAWRSARPRLFAGAARRQRTAAPPIVPRSDHRAARRSGRPARRRNRPHRRPARSRSADRRCRDSALPAPASISPASRQFAVAAARRLRGHRVSVHGRPGDPCADDRWSAGRHHRGRRLSVRPARAGRPRGRDARAPAASIAARAGCARRPAVSRRHRGRRARRCGDAL